jgi:transcriptional regulator with XRE-family HTH domain
MTPEDLAAVLRAGMEERGWTVQELANAAGVWYETARRATQAIGSTSLESTNKLLVAIGRKLEIASIGGNSDVEGVPHAA